MGSFAINFVWLVVVGLSFGIFAAQSLDTDGEQINLKAEYLVSYTNPAREIKKKHDLWTDRVKEMASVRLQNGSFYHDTGVLKLLHEKRWVPICGDYFNPTAGFMTCRQLGFTGLRDISFEQPQDETEMLTKLRCRGDESSIKDCSYHLAEASQCSKGRVILSCEEAKGCPDGWTPGMGKCYHLLTGVRSLKQAGAVCAWRGARLLSVGSEMEEGFVANMLANFAPDIHRWHTSGRQSNNDKWFWHQLLPLTQRDYQRQQQRRVNDDKRRPKTGLTKKFPGFMQTRNSLWPRRRRRIIKHSARSLSPVGMRRVEQVIDKKEVRSRRLSYGLDSAAVVFRRKFDKRAKPMIIRDVWDTWRARSKFETGFEDVDLQVQRSLSAYMENHHDSYGNCLTLSSDPIGDTSSTFYMKPDKCFDRHGLSFVCEMDNPDIDSEGMIARLVKTRYLPIRRSAVGIVELENFHHPGVKYSVCGEQWSDAIVNVACKMAGYPHGGFPFPPYIVRGMRARDSRRWIGFETTNSCSGKETSLMECKGLRRGQSLRTKTRYRNVHSGVCVGGEAAAVACNTLGWDPVPPPSELANKPDVWFSLEGSVGATSAGHVAVHVGNSNFRVCDNNWGINEATVTCKMMGFTSGGHPIRRSMFGHEKKEIIISSVRCNGTEKSLLECDATIGLRNNKCTRYQLAGVRCVGFQNGEVGVWPGGMEVTPNGDEWLESLNVCGRRPFDTKDLLLRKRRSISVSILEPHSNSKPRIVSGNPAAHGKYPWQVGIRELLNPNGHSEQHCGGTIISEYWILSAAHCFKGKRTNIFLFIVGDHDNEEPDTGEQTFKAEEVIIHEDYLFDRSKGIIRNDIALVKIRPDENGRGIVFNDFVQPACLPPQDFLYDVGQHCSISGWGTVKYGSRSIPRILQEASVPLIGWEECSELLDKSSKTWFTENMMCAGYLDGGSDACSGDSGGPLVCENHGVHTLVGITSWGRGCGLPNSPGAYTYVQKYTSWVDMVIAEHSHSDSQRKLPS